MYYKEDPNNYTRCEKCKHIDRENEECKITNDKWLVSDRAGTCHQYEGVNMDNAIKPNHYKAGNFDVITREMKDLYELKNKNYGNSFSLSYGEYGLTMICIRLEDKLRRLKSLNKQGEGANVDDESIRDTLIDLANYSVMAIMELDKEKS